MATLVEQIEALSREQVFEAVGFLGQSLGVQVDAQDANAAALAQLTDKPYQHLGELEQLTRITLVAAALTPEWQSQVQAAVNGVGKKQFVLGGLEIVALSIVALGALHVLVTSGKTSEDTTLVIREVDGKTEVEIKQKVKYGISNVIAEALGSIL